MKKILIPALILFLEFSTANISRAQWVLTKGWSFNSDPTSIVVSPDNSKIYTGDFGGGVFLSTDDGLHWNPINDSLLESGTSDSVAQVQAHYISNLAFLFTSNDTTLFAATYGGIYRLNGTTWKRTGFNNYSTGYNAVYQLGVKHNGKTLLAYIGDLAMYRSTNNGEIWTRTKNQLHSLNPFFIVSSPNDSLFFTGGLGNLSTNADTAVILHSSDNGDSWVYADSGLTGARTFALTFVPNGYGGLNLLAGTNTGIFLSEDHGITWVKINSFVVSSFAKSQDGLYLFAGGAGGILISNNNGRNWISIDSSFGEVNCIAVSNKYIFAGATYSGVYRRPLSEVTSIEMPISTTPSRFELKQNYPNPFNPSTTIRYNISKAEHVTLKVYNVLGQEVETLVDKEQQAGSHKVQFTIGSRQLASGVYLYRLQAGSFIQTKKMLLLK